MDRVAHDAVHLPVALRMRVLYHWQEQRHQQFHDDFPFVFWLIALRHDAMHIPFALGLNVFYDCQEQRHQQIHAEFPIASLLIAMVNVVHFQFH